MEESKTKDFGNIENKNIQMATDSQRLKTLQEVTNTRAYNKRKESKESLKQTTLAYLNQGLKELQQQLDKSKQSRQRQVEPDNPANTQGTAETTSMSRKTSCRRPRTSRCGWR